MKKYVRPRRRHLAGLGNLGTCGCDYGVFMVELILTCVATEPSHEFKKTFGEKGQKIDWPTVTWWVKAKDLRCDLHPLDNWGDCGCDD